MTNCDYLVRNVPNHIDNWILKEMGRTGMKKTEYVRSVLEYAYNNESSPTLFDLVGPEIRFIPESLPFTFIDLFAGIGGFRIGLTKLGGKCVFTSEYDKYARRTYSAWFKENDEQIFGDINQLDTPSKINSHIPDHDVLAAGFPCQPFSIAGVSKKQSLGVSHGFECEKQGNLFFKIVDIITAKRPPVLILENVKNLKSHDKGKTWAIIEQTLSKELGYHVFSKTIDASSWVPQHRERILIVCFSKDIFGKAVDFHFPEPSSAAKPSLNSILEEDPDHKYVLTDHLWKYLKDYAEKHRRQGNGFGYGLNSPEDRARTLSARYYKDGSEILIKAPKGGFKSFKEEGKSKTNPRRLTIRECSRLMGFHESNADLFGHDNGFPQVVSDTQAYKQFGNAVVPAVVESVGRGVINVLSDHIRNSGNGCLIKNGQGVAVKKAAG